MTEATGTLEHEENFEPLNEEELLELALHTVGMPEGDEEEELILADQSSLCKQLLADYKRRAARYKQLQRKLRKAIQDYRQHKISLSDLHAAQRATEDAHNRVIAIYRRMQRNDC